MISYARSSPPEPASITFTPLGISRPSSRCATTDPKPSSSIHALPTPATRICFSNSGNLDLARLEVQVAADVAHDVLAGDVVDGDRQVHGAVVVVIDPLDGRPPPRHEVVLRRRVDGRPQDDGVAAAVDHAVDLGRRLALAPAGDPHPARQGPQLPP